MTARLMTLLAAAIAITAIVVAGCGGDEDSGNAGSPNADITTEADQASGAESGADSAPGDESSAGEGITTSSLSKEQFVERANSICRREKASYDGEITAFLERSRPNMPEDVVALMAIKAVLVPITESQIAAIRKLGAPEGDEEEIAAALEAEEEALAELMQTERLKFGELPTDMFEDANARLREYGLKGCVFFP